MAFKKGDVVFLSDDRDQSKGDRGTVKYVDRCSFMPYLVKWKNGYVNRYKESHLVLVANKTMNVYGYAKSILSKKHRTLVNAEFLSRDLQITSDGKNALIAILFKKHEAELIKLAEEKLAEEKKEK